MRTGIPEACAVNGRKTMVGFTSRRVACLLLGAMVTLAILWIGQGVVERADRSATMGTFQYCLRSLWDNAEHDPERIMPAVFFDDSGCPLYSWRFRALMIGISWRRPGDWRRPWDSAENAHFRSMTPPPIYVCYPKAEGPHPCVFAITGPGTAFGVNEPCLLEDLEPDLILLVEVRNSENHWMEPGDFDIRTMPRTLNDPGGQGISSRHKRGFHVGFADGRVWFLSEHVPFDKLEQFFTIAGAAAASREEVLGPYLLDAYGRR